MSRLWRRLRAELIVLLDACAEIHSDRGFWQR